MRGGSQGSGTRYKYQNLTLDTITRKKIVLGTAMKQLITKILGGVKWSSIWIQVIKSAGLL